jgi:hypothetical protein
MTYVWSGIFAAGLLLIFRTKPAGWKTSRPPDLIIRTPAEIWLAVTRRELDGQQAFFQNADQVEGGLGLLIQMKVLFSGRGDG